MLQTIHKNVFFYGCLFCFCAAQGNAWYSEYWQQLFWKMWQNDTATLGTFVRVESDDYFKNIRSTQVNEQFDWQTSEDVYFGIHYAYIHGRSVVNESPWRWIHRLELEANRIFHPNASCSIRTRNRLEIQRVEKQPKTLYRFRQRTMLVVPIEGRGCLMSFSMFNELFYEITHHRVSQNRICPFQLSFAMANQTSLDLFFLIRLFHSGQNWKKSAILGTQVNF